ncbi:hypothetical protein LIA77_09426 [Sarocladium implicatum]|nr:hypothetical protein LIA77_09426 [Sarocladium implicatum]
MYHQSADQDTGDGPSTTLRLVRSTTHTLVREEYLLGTPVGPLVIWIVVWHTYKGRCLNPSPGVATSLSK